MYKVLHIITRLDKTGPSRVLQSLMVNLSQEKYKLKIIAGPVKLSEEKLRTYILKNGVGIVQIHQLRRNINLINDAIAFFRLYFIIKKEKPAIVHTHTSKAGILGRWAARWAGVPIIVHTPHGHIFYGYFGRLKTKFYIFLEKITAYITDKIITLTETGKNEYIMFGIAKADKFVTIPNGIEVEKYLNCSIDNLAKRKELNLQSGDYLITVIARLEPVKGHMYFLRAMQEIKRQIPRVKALIAGDGELRKRLEAQAKRLNILDVVSFLGTRDDILEIISTSDLIVLPSLNEGLGLVLLEAGALEKPVVATRVGGIPEIVLDERTGVLVPPKNPLALKEAIIRLAKDKDLCKRLAVAARDWIGANFSSGQMLKKYSLLYEKLLLEKNS